MHISVFMGPVALGERQDLPQIELCIEHAIRAADAGFAMVTFGEQHFNNYEPYSNPFLMGARLAPHLGDTWFGTTIVPLVLHHPLRLAEDSNVIDLLTRGRFLMGLSQGRVGFSPDFANFGLDPERRSEIFASKLDILQRAQRQKFDDASIVMDTEWDKGMLQGRLMPVSWRRGGAQIAIGTNTPQTVDAVGAKGMPLFLGPTTRDNAAALMSRHRAALAAAAHDHATQQDASRKSLVTRHVFVGRTDAEAWEIAEAMAGMVPMLDRVNDSRSFREMAAAADAAASGADPHPKNVEWVNSWIIAGSPETVARELRAYDDAGISHVNTRFNVGPYNKPLADASFQLFIDEVLPHIGNERFPALRPDEIDPIHMAVPAGVA
jgi:alkanesulfonate monooxygenase SsuD/methylene tetrahydromethanopterin reductase-like flavin-dependent oxidoreductase (luciferase family)